MLGRAGAERKGPGLAEKGQGWPRMAGAVGLAGAATAECEKLTNRMRNYTDMRHFALCCHH